MTDTTNFYDDVMAGIRQGLEEGLMKQASDGTLSDEDKEFIDQTMVEMEKDAGLFSFLKETVPAALSSNTIAETMTSQTTNTLDNAGKIVDSIRTDTKTFNPRLRAIESMAEGFGAIVPRVAVPLGVGAGILAATKAAKAIINQIDKNKFEGSYRQALSTNKMLDGEDPVKLRSLADTIFRLAPHVACDPNLLSTVLQEQIKNFNGMTTQKARELVDLEDKLSGRSSNSFKPKDILAG